MNELIFTKDILIIDFFNLKIKKEKEKNFWKDKSARFSRSLNGITSCLLELALTTYLLV